MNVSESISSIINRINQSEDNWKVLYMGTWGFSYKIKEQFENTSDWDKQIAWGLPSSKNKYHIYTPHQLHSLLTSKDTELTFGHLLTLFSLFEDLLKEASKIICSSELDASKGSNIKRFFEENENKGILTDLQVKELKLAKETRNCYTHNGGKIDQRWLDSYLDVRDDSTAKIGDSLINGFGGFDNLFHQIEEWQILIVDITNKIKNNIENKSQ